MNRQEKKLFIVSKLQDLYGDPPIPLYHKDTYTLLVAVLLSARCTDERVNQVTPLLFKLADNPKDMMLHKYETVRAIIKSCGLSPFKSKSIVDLSRILVQEYNSIVPSSFEELERLPGVGHKTASVVMSQAFNIPAFPVDTHVHRLSFRWGISSGKSIKKTEEDCKNYFLKSMWGKLHLQMIYFGREYCSARKHNIINCPICSVVNRKKVFK